MSTIKQILQHHHQGKSIRWSARAVKVSRNTVRKYLGMARELDRPLEELLSLDDHELEALLYPSQPSTRDERLADLQGRYEYLRRELARTGVTRFLLWTEYKQAYPGGHSYSQFCWRLGQLDKQNQVCAVLDHRPGDLLYLDFAGQTIEYVDLPSGEIRKGQVFIATLGYSQYSYLEALPSQKTEDLIQALNHTLAFLGGVPQGLVPDNLKSAVIRSDRYEPTLNRMLEEFANPPRRSAIIPARPGKPKDKALVEAMVRNAYTRIYAPLRNRTFYSLEEVNQGIRSQLQLWHQSRFQGRDYTRADLFARERAYLSPLPAEAFQIRKRRQVTVQKNSHVWLGEDRHYYSVPYQWIGQRVSLIYTRNLVSIYAGTRQVATHRRDPAPHRYTTLKEHLPSHLQHYLDRSPDWYERQAARIAPEAVEVVRAVLASKRHPEQAYKSCDGLLALARKTPRPVFVSACRMALDLGACNYGFLKRVISNGAAAQSPLFDPPQKPLPKHPNTRGKAYYTSTPNRNHQQGSKDDQD